MSDLRLLASVAPVAVALVLAGCDSPTSTATCGDLDRVWGDNPLIPSDEAVELLIEVYRAAHPDQEQVSVADIGRRAADARRVCEVDSSIPLEEMM
jgi:hypothetical protein